MLLKKFSPTRKSINGFTLTELLLSTSIGVFVVFITLSFLRNITSDFKTSSSRQDLQDQTSTALDLIASEVRSSKRISTYLSLNPDLPSIDKKCLPGNMSDYLFSIELPRQVSQSDVYKSNLSSPDYYEKHFKDWQPNLNKLHECPYIVFYLRKKNRKNERGPYVLMRHGFNFNSLGYYDISKKSDTVILDSISQSSNSSSSPRLKKVCPSFAPPYNKKWDLLQKHGFTACVDPERRTILLKVSTDYENKQISSSSKLYQWDSRGSSSLIARGGTTSTFGGHPINSCDQLVFLIDLSGSMSWGHSKYPGRSRLSVALDELSNAISSCPDSGTINVMTFAHDSRNSFSCLPTISKLTPAIRAQLLACLSRMYGSGGTIPWKQINAVFNSPAKELIILSDGAVYPSDHVARNTWTHIYYGIYFRTPEWSTRFGHLPSLYIDYNKGPRRRNPLLIRAVSLDLDFCTGQRQASRNWLGVLSSGNCKLM